MWFWENVCVSTSQTSSSAQAIPRPAFSAACLASGYNPLQFATSHSSNCSAAPASTPAAPVQDQEQDNCVVCWEREREVLLVPCGHTVLCQECVNAILQSQTKMGSLCPYCRASIISYKLHWAWKHTVPTRVLVPHVRSASRFKIHLFL